MVCSKAVLLMSNLPRIVLTGGISGGHTFPLIAVARVLRKRYPQGVELLFIGSNGPFESSAMAEENIPVRHILYGKRRRYFSWLNYLDFFKVPIGYVQALWHLLWFMPDAVFSKGGAVSVPVVLAARLYRIPVLIHDSDSIAGRANAFLGKFAGKIAIAYPSAAQFFPIGKTVLTGNPVREELTIGSREEGMKLFSLDQSEKTILVIGGSQGAQGLNSAVLRVLPSLLMRHYQVIHQVGTANLPGVEETVAELGISGGYHPVAFLDPKTLGHAYAAADLIISRAGAGSIAEIAANRKATILVPLPSAANDEQRKNAYDIAAIGGAVVLEEANLGEHLLIEKVSELMNNDGLRAEMGEKISVFFHPDAAEKIADGVIDLLRQH